jgi:hypothetical protein
MIFRTIETLNKNGILTVGAGDFILKEKEL